MKYSHYQKIIKEAFEYHKIITADDFLRILVKRAKSETVCRDIFYKIEKILAPSYCEMSHCEARTAYAFCGCGKGLIPHKCKKHRAYKKRKKERYEKQLNEVVALYHEKVRPDRTKDYIEKELHRVCDGNFKRYKQAINDYNKKGKL